MRCTSRLHHEVSAGLPVAPAPRPCTQAGYPPFACKCQQQQISAACPKPTIAWRIPIPVALAVCLQLSQPFDAAAALDASPLQLSPQAAYDISLDGSSPSAPPPPAPPLSDSPALPPRPWSSSQASSGQPGGLRAQGAAALDLGQAQVLARLRRPPLLVLDLQLPGWAQLAAVVLANVLGLKAVLGVLKGLGDNSEPITLVKLQWGLVEEHSQLRSRLAALSSMNQVGQTGLWLMLEESLSELSRHQRTCTLADVGATYLESKARARDLFGQVARMEAGKALEEQALVGAGEEGCEVSWQQPAQPTANSLLQWLHMQPPSDSACDDALVVTLVVATRGHIQVPERLERWQDLGGVMKALAALTSDRLIGVDLSWTPGADDEFLTRSQLVAGYPHLKPLRR